MSINKDSTSEEVCIFLKQILKKDDIIQKFINENIKGNELFYLTEEDFNNFVKYSRKE